MRAICSVCGEQHDDIRIRTDKGAWGPVDVQTCQACHEREIESVRAEAKRFRMRLAIPKPWAKLTTQGAFSEVR